VRRGLHGFAELSQLVNTDPDKHYVIVSKLDRAAIATYEAMGYEYERYAPDGRGVRPRGVPPDQLKKLAQKHETIETMDGYVMGINKKLLAEVNHPRVDYMQRIADMMKPRRGQVPHGFGNPLADMDPRVRDEYFQVETFSKGEGAVGVHGDDDHTRV
jgi:hypothetical protein